MKLVLIFEYYNNKIKNLQRLKQLYLIFIKIIPTLLIGIGTYYFRS